MHFFCRVLKWCFPEVYRWCFPSCTCILKFEHWMGYYFHFLHFFLLFFSLSCFLSRMIKKKYKKNKFGHLESRKIKEKRKNEKDWRNLVIYREGTSRYRSLNLCLRGKVLGLITGTSNSLRVLCSSPKWRS